MFDFDFILVMSSIFISNMVIPGIRWVMCLNGNHLSRQLTIRLFIEIDLYRWHTLIENTYLAFNNQVTNRRGLI